MENVFECKVKFDAKHNYLDVNIYNSVYNNIELEDAIVKYTVKIVRTELDAINVEFDSLTNLIISYIADDNNITEILDKTKLNDYIITTEVYNSEFTGLLLTGFDIDVIKKTIKLFFN